MIQVENLHDEIRAEKEVVINTKYLGNHANIKNTEGTCYYKDGVWFYTPAGEDEEYRVDGKNLDCNTQDGWIRCLYSGDKRNWLNNKVLTEVEGKAYFDEDDNVWKFKPKGNKELFRMSDGGNLKFFRD